MTDDGPVYFCCEMCIPKFKKDPQKYAEKVATQRSVLAKFDRIQVSCPVDDKVVDGKITASVGGQTIAFCSKECQAEYEKSPAEFKARLAGSYTYQTLCPVTGEKIQPSAFTDLPTGQRIYFCCPSCSPKLLKDPAKFAPKLAEQGITIDPEKVAAAADRAKSSEQGKHDEHKQP
jgi:YHS domain-containing protein